MEVVDPTCGVPRERVEGTGADGLDEGPAGLPQEDSVMADDDRHQQGAGEQVSPFEWKTMERSLDESRKAYESVLQKDDRASTSGWWPKK